jgi:hypothetical protein
MRQCADDVRAAYPKNRRAIAPVAAVLAAADQTINGQGELAANGLGDLIMELATAAPPKKRSIVLAIQALAQFAFALEEAAQGDPRGVVEQHLSDARDFAAMSVGRAEAPPSVVDTAARIATIEPGDVTELLAVIDVVAEQHMKKLIPAIFEHLELDDAVAAGVRKLHDLHGSRVDLFSAMCASFLTHPRAGTRRWAIRGLDGGVRPEHVPQLIELLSDAEPKVRKEAAGLLRAAVSWHPQTKSAIHEGAERALASYPDDAALAELVRKS